MLGLQQEKLASWFRAAYAGRCLLDLAQ